METYTAYDWIRDRVLGTLGIIPEGLAASIPVAAAATSPRLAGIKGGLTFIANLFPPIPHYNELPGLNPRVANVLDEFDILRAVAAVIETPGRILGGEHRDYIGVPGLGGVLVPRAFWGRDP